MYAGFFSHSPPEAQVAQFGFLSTGPAGLGGAPPLLALAASALGGAFFFFGAALQLLGHLSFMKAAAPREATTETVSSRARRSSRAGQ